MALFCSVTVNAIPYKYIKILRSSITLYVSILQVGLHLSQKLQLTFARNLRRLLTSGVSRAMENQYETPSITAQEIG